MKTFFSFVLMIVAVTALFFVGRDVGTSHSATLLSVVPNERVEFSPPSKPLTRADYRRGVMRVS